MTCVSVAVTVNVGEGRQKVQVNTETGSAVKCDLIHWNKTLIQHDTKVTIDWCVPVMQLRPHGAPQATRMRDRAQSQ